MSSQYTIVYHNKFGVEYEHLDTDDLVSLECYPDVVWVFKGFITPLTKEEKKEIFEKYELLLKKIEVE